LRSYIVNGETLNDVTLQATKAYIKNVAMSSQAYLDQTAKSITDKNARGQGLDIPKEGETGSSAYQNIAKDTKRQISDAFSVLVYERFFTSGPIQALMEAIRARSGAFQFREWEVPMMRVELDSKAVIVNGVSVSFGNNLAKLQLQMQDEPTYQHIGGRDSYINISMTVIGEKELSKIKRIFDHVNGLARLEHASGVLGFMGIKNIITALAGIKYVIPSNYSVTTMPSYPHTYRVDLTLMDFDVFQQTREKLNSSQEKDFADTFKSKRNPFLRIKQLWGSFNAYPDLPLQLRDEERNVIGTLDPDFYFRSFDMFDKDVIRNIKTQTKIPSFDWREKQIRDEATIMVYLKTFVRSYNANLVLGDFSKEDKLKELLQWLDESGVDYYNFSEILRGYSVSSGNIPEYDSGIPKYDSGTVLYTDFLNFYKDKTEDPNQAIYNSKIPSAPYQVGDLGSANSNAFNELEMALSGMFSLPDEEDVSFDPDKLEFHANIQMMPIKDPIEPNKIPAILITAQGSNFGYIDTEKNSRFYLTVGGYNVQKGSNRVNLNPTVIDEHSNPATGTTTAAISGLASLSAYANPISHGDTNQPEWSNKSSKPPVSVNSHWEKMLVDTQYRDMSGRMVRAFPTYMLWLIDEGGFFAGVKLFDNFYGLQSIIDFSVVSSEDLLGDTLIFRVSNLYSKLSKAPAEDIFSPDSFVGGSMVGEQMSSILSNTLNKAKNLQNHMRSDYVVNIENIILKPGVRVHLRGGYGANPNTLQTLFNGTVTQVEYGEIVTVTAQSDAIELGAVVNSTNKKGDSGKIDGGINTGLWLSEPRDLMVRLLSMGSSRFREGIANANRGLVFSENKFGIRHFGNMLYEPLTDAEAARHYARVDAIADAYRAVSELTVSGGVKAGLDLVGIGVPEFRTPIASLMGQLWSNFSAQRDMEIFKRNIYPGNGTGIAQFLGGDLGDGWTSIASITPENKPNDRLEYLSRLSDQSWNGLMKKADTGSATAKDVIDNITKSGSIRDSSSRSKYFKRYSVRSGSKSCYGCGWTSNFVYSNRCWPTWSFKW